MKNPMTYKEYIRYKVLFILLMGLVVVLTVLWAISSGSAGLSMKVVVATLFGYGSRQASIIVFKVVIPAVSVQ